jgi:putative ABC transport system permease protein
MFKNYLKITLRYMLKQKGYSFINVAGLAIGVACCLIIVLYVVDELNYDRFHEKAGRIYRLATGYVLENGSVEQLATTPSMWGSTMAAEFPEVETAVRFYRYRSEILVRTAVDRQFYEGNFFFADSTVLEIFSFPLTAGDPQQALTAPNALIISQSMAAKYFPQENPLGKTLTYVNRETEFELQITGVMRDIPHNTHFRPDFIASLSTFQPGTWHWLYDLPTSWTNSFYRTYVLLAPGADPKQVEARLPAFLERHIGEEASAFKPFLQRLTDIHLHSALTSEFQKNGNINYVYIFATIAILILLVACINYMNLSTARSASRAREIGLRKTLGSQRGQLVAQFYTESILMAYLAVLLALPLVEVFLPLFNQLTEKNLSLRYFFDGASVIYLLGFTFLVGLLAGSYPALYLSGFLPAAILKGWRASLRGQGSSGRTVNLRKALVVLQFSVSVLLIFSTVVVSGQLDFLRQGRLSGADQIVVIPLRGGDVYQNYETYKQEILRHAEVSGAAASAYVPFSGYKTSRFVLPEVLGSESVFECDYLATDEDFPALFDLKLIAGRGFSYHPRKNEVTEFLLNQNAVQKLGLTPERALGMRVQQPFFKQDGEVVGVVQDFHYASLHQAIAPMIVINSPDFVRFLSVKVKTGNLIETLSFLRQRWEAIFPESLFVFSFLDEDLNRLYRVEEKMGQVFGYFTILAVVISCLGLFGLAAFAAEQRTKEIGVRKVLGASVSGIAALLSKEFLKLVLLANLIAWPVAWVAMNQWLQNFAYRIEIGWWVFALASGVALLIALLTVSTQAIKAALANPVKSLRYE